MVKILTLAFLINTISVLNILSQSNNPLIKLGHNLCETSPIFLLDGLKMDSTSFFKLTLTNDQIEDVIPVTSENKKKKYNFVNKCGVIEIYTKILVILNGKKLKSRNEKWLNLEEVPLNSKPKIVQINSYEALDHYGKEGKYGVILIEFTRKN